MTEIRKVLITGGTGFIGVPLCAYLNQAGFELTVLTRDPERSAKLLPVGVKLVRNLDELPPVAFACVINLAGEPLAAGRWSEGRKAAFRESRIGTTQRLLSHFEGLGVYPQVLISGSAIGFYGDRKDEVLFERSSAGQGFAAELCRDWENSAQVFADKGTRVCLLRTGIVLASGGGVLAKMLPAFRMGLGGRMGDGQQWMSWIYRDDLIRLIAWCIESDISGPVNGVAPQAVTNQQFTRILADVLGRPGLLPLPKFLLRILMGEMADSLLLASQRVAPDLAQRGGFVFSYPDLAGALKASID